jgi:hypothetical protein
MTQQGEGEITEAMTACTQAIAALRQADACLMAVKDRLYALQEAENGN